MLSPGSRRSIDSLSPTSPNSLRGQYYPRAGVGGRFHTQLSSLAGSVAPIGSTLDAVTNWYGLSESGRNSISTLLQSPIIRSGSITQTSASASNIYSAPTTRDIPPVALSPIPKYDPDEIKLYLSQVGSLYGALGDTLERAKENEEEHGNLLSRKSSRSDSVHSQPEPTRRVSGRSNHSRQASAISASPIEGPRRRSAAGRRVANTLAPLSTVPNVFFEENFHLENPRTFDVVSERSELVKPAQPDADKQKTPSGIVAAPRKALISNTILQEKLSWYMDTVEIHLVNSISSASNYFFTALGSLRKLHLETSTLVNRIKTLRKDLTSLDEDLALGRLKIVSMKQRRENLKKLSDTILQLQSVVEAFAKCKCLVEEGEVEKALDSIDVLENLALGECSGNDNQKTTRDLKEAASLKTLTSDINALRYRIGKVFELRFSNLLIDDLKRFASSVSATDTLQRWNISSQRSRGHYREHSYPAYLNVSSEFRSQLSEILRSLHRAQHISPATTVYRDSALREIRILIRQQLPTSSDDDTESMASVSTADINQPRTKQEKMKILARNLRLLGSLEGEEMLKNIYVGVAETLRRISTQEKVLLDITSTFGGNRSTTNSPRSPGTRNSEDRINKGSSLTIVSRETQEEMHSSLNMSDLVGQAVDIAQDKIVKLLRVRSEKTNLLSVKDFLRYFTLNLLFANECEAVSGRSGTSLKNLVNGHIKEFARQLGESQRQALATGMESDAWNAKDFTEADNDVLLHIITSKTQDVEAWTAGTYQWTNNPADPKSDVTENESVVEKEKQSEKNTEPTMPSKLSIRSAFIESKSYILPNPAILCLHGLSSFLHLNTGIPSMTYEIASSILSYLTLFNSRCTQLILGAGATRSAGLKNITTKHLALASQALSFISTLITHIQEFVRRHISSSNTTILSEFSKVQRSYLEHQKSISDKLVEIMASRTTAHIRSMRLLDWSKENEGVNAYMETLAKETNTLNRVLIKHLPQTTVNDIMGLVLENYEEQWSKAFREVSLVSENAKERMLRDVEWFRTKIGHLDSSGEIGESLVNLVKEKELILKSVSSTIPVSAVPGLSKVSRQVTSIDKSEDEKTDNSGKSEEQSKETTLSAG